MENNICENERLKEIIKQIDELTGFDYDTMPEAGRKKSHELVCEIINKFYRDKYTKYDPPKNAGYAAGIEYSKSYAVWMPNNCAVIERTADGVSVGPCTHYLENGTTCPRHGKIKPHNIQ